MIHSYVFLILKNEQLFVVIMCMWDVGVRRQPLKQIFTIRVTDDQGSWAKFS
jgi:hypothetical protein